MTTRVLLLLLALLPTLGVRAHYSASAPRFTKLATLDRGERFGISGQFSEQVAFSPDGAYVAAGVRGGVAIWELATGEVIRTLPSESFAVAWSPDGRWLTTGDTSVDGTLRLWDATTGDLRNQFDQNGSDAGMYSSWSPDSSRFVVDSGQVIDPEAGDIIMQLEQAWAIPHGTFWSPDGAKIAITTGWTGSFLHVYSAADGVLLDTFWSDQWAAWSPDGSRIASTAQIRDVSTGLPALVMPELYGHLAWSPGGRWIVSSGYWGYSNKSGALYVWDAESGALLTTLQRPGCSTRGIAWSADGTRFAASCFYGEERGYQSIIQVWSVEDGGLAFVSLPPESSRSNQMYTQPPAQISPDGLHSLEAEHFADPRLGPIYIYTQGAGRSAPIYNAADVAWWSPDGTQMATVSDLSTLRFYDTSTGALLDTVRGFPDGETTIDPVSNERYIVTRHGSYAGAYPPPRFAVYDVETRAIAAAGGIGLGDFELHGDRLYWNEVMGARTEYDLTGQREPIVHPRE